MPIEQPGGDQVLGLAETRGHRRGQAKEAVTGAVTDKGGINRLMDDVWGELNEREREKKRRSPC